MAPRVAENGFDPPRKWVWNGFGMALVEMYELKNLNKSAAARPQNGFALQNREGLDHA